MRMQRGLVALIVLLFSVPSLADGAFKNLSRLLIYNPQGEVLVIKVDAGIWVTPALYHHQQETIKTSLNTLLADYGLKASEPALHAVMMLYIERDQSASQRNVYVVHDAEGELQLPPNIVEARWVTVDEAQSLLSLSQIRDVLMQTHRHPKTLWGATYILFSDKEGLQARVLEDFYSLSPH